MLNKKNLEGKPYSNLILSVSAPSGAGKTSLVNALLARNSSVHVSISHTTRPRRPKEEDGVHYHFVDSAKFDELVKAGQFLEHAEVFGHSYGTSVSSLLHPLERGKDVLLDIDWQGAASAKALFPHNAVGVFILPPSQEVLEKRLRLRGQDSEEVILRRLAEAGEEMLHAKEYDYVIVNDVFEHALAELEAILLAERCRFASQAKRYPELFSNFKLI